MLALRVSATDLDALRRFLSAEDADLAELLAQLRRELPPSDAMQAGTALHAILESADVGTLRTAEADGFRFDFDVEGEVDLPDIREMKATRDYKIDGVRVTLVGKVDAVHGRRVDDHKFTQRFDPERFMGSMQWRVYCSVFGADTFRWNVFEGREVGGAGSRHYSIHAIHSLVMHRYPGMEDDVERAVREFLDFARVHLPEKLQPWEPLPSDYLAIG